MTLIKVTATELLTKTYAPRESLLGSWLRQRSFVMVHAPAGVGKSMLCMGMAMAIAAGTELLGWKAPKQRTVLYYDAEMDEVDLQDRVRTLAEAMGLEPQDFGDRLVIVPRLGQKPGTEFPDITSAEGTAQILKDARETGAELIILDNFSMMASVEDENRASAFDPVIHLVMELKREGLSVLLIHHSRKGSAASKDSYRGSSKMDAPLDVRIGLSHPSLSDDFQGTAFKLEFHKKRSRVEKDVRMLEAFLEQASGQKARWRVLERGMTEDEARYVEGLKSMVYPNQKVMEEALGWKKPKASRVKTSLIDKGIMTAEQFKLKWSEAASAHQ